MDLSWGAGPRQATGHLLLVALLAALALGGAWIIQAAGYPPCELCLLQRYPYYAGVPLAFAAALAAFGGWSGAARLGALATVALFLVSAALGTYHAGVEWHWWAGPTGCTGAVSAPAAVGDFLRQLETVKVVRCDAAALRVAGLSLAGWNVLVSAACAGLALLGFRRLQAAARSTTASPVRTVPSSTMRA